MHTRKIAIIILVFLGIFCAKEVLADAVRVISYGADLTDAQRDKVYGIFGLEEGEKKDIAVTEVSNKEEKKYLEGLVEPKVIGSKAISCAYVELLEAGAGITVKTHNITWVTPEMYASALTTGEVKDAKVVAAAPFPVSGTAALTGIFKAFEAATGKNLDREAKVVANEEMVRTGEIGEAIDNNHKAADLVIRIKEEVIKRNLSDPSEIRQVVINISQDLNVQLTEKQIQQLVSLMQKINGLNLSASEIGTQLADIRSKLDTLVAQSQGIRGFLQRILDFLAQIVNGIKSLLS
ncbi:DUF1002 domain-containing protein [Candidatus Formimonas warabiya]|uniref:DUF1002 domain-containing protein n=1 Tax=Formimonas warabiya TaxID=1761012 RepID=A0A3G1KXC6_FORW1|nr:DUF1002 domain-containing protein [Candidatus Formimonas warabiya]ATW27092.1 hypothetical protein DCMF_22145 [Candidatus Formimonas warabiya]